MAEEEKKPQALIEILEAAMRKRVLLSFDRGRENLFDELADLDSGSEGEAEGLVSSTHLSKVPATDVVEPCQRKPFHVRFVRFVTNRGNVKSTTRPSSNADNPKVS